MNAVELEVIVRRDDKTGGYWAEVVQLPGCFAAGHTREELQESLAEAVQLYLRGSGLINAAPSEHIDSVERFRLTADQRLIPA